MSYVGHTSSQALVLLKMLGYNIQRFLVFQLLDC